MQPGRTRWTWVNAAWILLPLGAWLVGCLWFGGDLGRSADDYSVNLRDPATGELPSPFNPWARYPFFWRPLHNAMCFGLGTLLAGQWRVLVLLCAVLHAIACLCVYALLRRTTHARGPAAVGALALLLHPMNFEVTFWLCSISAAIATALWCLYALRCMTLIRRDAPPRLHEVFGLALLALVIPCFYEQPASGLLALPLLLLGAWVVSPSGPRLPVAFARATVLCGIAGAMNVLYIVLLRLTAPTSFRGGSNSFVAPDRLADRVAEVARSVRWQLYGTRLRQTAAGAWQTGIEALATPVGIAAIVALAILVLVWAWAWWAEEQDENAGNVPAPRSRARSIAARVCTIAAGAVLFVGAFVPIAAMARQNVEPRTLYFPLVGLCIMLAQAVDLLLIALPVTGRAAPVGRACRACMALAAGSAAIAGAVCCVGLQAWCNHRSHRDESIAAQLVELVPDPPAAAVYVPLALDAGATPTGRLLFDRLRPAAFATTWSATALMRQRTRRADVVAAAINPWAAFPYDRISADGLWFAFKLDGRASSPVAPAGEGAEGGKGDFIAWDRAIPFVIDDSGTVRLVRQVEIVRSDDRVESFTMPVVRAAIRAGTARGRATTASLTDSADPIPSTVAGWRWLHGPDASSTGAVAMQSLNSRGTRRDGAWLHPTFQAASRAAMVATVDPAPRARQLRFRLTTPPEDYARFANARPVVISVELLAGGADSAPIAAASVDVTRERAEAEPRWIPLMLDVPPMETTGTLRVRVAGSKIPGATHAPVWITPGMWTDVP